MKYLRKIWQIAKSEKHEYLNNWFWNIFKNFEKLESLKDIKIFIFDLEISSAKIEKLQNLKNMNIFMIDFEIS